MGLSPAPFLVLFGLIVLAIMLKWERHREATTGSALIPRRSSQRRRCVTVSI